MRLWPWGGQDNTDEPIDLAASTEQLLGMYELNDMLQNLEAQYGKDFVTKTYSLLDFQGAVDNLLDETGHFGLEFNLRSTVGRLKSLYLREPWVAIGADLIGGTMSSLKWDVYNKAADEVDDTHPLNAQINAGNQLQDKMLIEWNGGIDLTAAGNFFRVFDEQYKVQTQCPVETVQLRLRKASTEEERALVERLGPVEGIEIRKTGSGNYKPLFVPWERVVHHKLPNPYNPYYGMSLLTAASRPILLDRHKNEFELAFYLRGATNTGVIETAEDMTKERMRRLMQTYENAYTGKRNWWRTLFLPKGAKWVNAQLNMKEMQHLEGLKENRLTLLARLRIPPSQVGIVQDVNRSTSEAQEKVFWQNTIVPFSMLEASGWNNSYLVKTIYNGEVEIRPNFIGTPVEGSIASKKEDVDAGKDVLTINEIRQDIFGYEPLKASDPRGNLFISQITPLNDADGDDFGPEDPDTDQGEDNTDSTDDDKTIAYKQIKQTAQEAQANVEKIMMSKYGTVFDKYREKLVETAAEALTDNSDVAKRLESTRSERTDYWTASMLPVLNDAMDRGFTLANTTTKSLSQFITTRDLSGRYPTKRSRFTAEDEQAIEALRQREQDNRRTLLANRGIERFVGTDEVQTEQIMRLIEEGQTEGLTTEQTSTKIREEYGERYGDQAFTIARTETLTAVSEGLWWQHETLKEVFSQVYKKWLHVGDAPALGGSNPDARNSHALFEKEGPEGDGVVPSDHIYTDNETGGKLKYPRDPMGGAASIINCRCTLTSVIPPTATSNASAILETI